MHLFYRKSSACLGILWQFNSYAPCIYSVFAKQHLVVHYVSEIVLQFLSHNRILLICTKTYGKNIIGYACYLLDRSSIKHFCCHCKVCNQGNVQLNINRKYPLFHRACSLSYLLLFITVGPWILFLSVTWYTVNSAHPACHPGCSRFSPSNSFSHWIDW